MYKEYVSCKDKSVEWVLTDRKLSQSRSDKMLETQRAPNASFFPNKQAKSFGHIAVYMFIQYYPSKGSHFSTARLVGSS